MKSGGFHGRSSPFMYICIGSDEIQDLVVENPLFMKSGGFHGEIWQIS